MRNYKNRLSSKLAFVGLAMFAVISHRSIMAQETVVLHPTLKYTAGWIGNDLPYPKWVQNNGNCMAVASDGTCFVGAGWEESGCGVGLYKNGDIIARLGDGRGNHWSMGLALTAYKGNVYVATIADRIFKDKKGADESCDVIGRYDTQGTIVPFDAHDLWIEDSQSDDFKRIQASLDAQAKAGKFRYSLPTLTEKQVVVIRNEADKTEQFSAVRIEVLNRSDLKELYSIPCPPAAASAAVEPGGALWVLEKVNNQPTALKQYAHDGKPTGKEIVPDPKSSAIKINRQNQLLVSRINNSTQEYDISQPQPVLANDKPDSVLEGLNGSFIKINCDTEETDHARVVSLAGYKDELYVVEKFLDPITKEWATRDIRVFDSETMQEKIKFACDKDVWRIVIDAKGRMWQLRHNLDGTQNSPASIVQTNLDGELTGEVITNADGAMGISLSPTGDLLVAGPHQQVYDYDLSGANPVLTRKFGEEDGAYAGPNPGLMGPKRLQGLIEAGMDEKGNLYTFGSMLASGGGTDLRSFSNAGELNWKLEHSSGFTDVADVDPDSDGLDVYTRGAHFVIDPDKPPGQQWIWKGVTIDPRYDDGRASGSGFNWGTPMVRRLEGRLYLYEHPGNYLGIFRKGDGEMFVPSGLISFAAVWTMRNAPFIGAHGTELIWPIEQPSPRARWIWRDKNGDGKIQANEFDQYPNYMEARDLNCQWVDTKGDIWITTGSSIIKIPLDGFDAQKNPIYSWDHAVAQPMPKEMVSIARVIYDQENDVMYLAGQSPELPKTRHPGFIGSVVFRYDHWSNPQNRVMKWKINLPLARKRTPIQIIGDFQPCPYPAIVFFWRNAFGPESGRLTLRREVMWDSSPPLLKRVLPAGMIWNSASIPFKEKTEIT